MSEQNRYLDFANSNSEQPEDMIFIGDSSSSMGMQDIEPNRIEAVRLAREYKYSVIVSHRSGETNDDFIVDLAHGVGADGIKIGSPARGERIAKFNRFLEIEQE